MNRPTATTAALAALLALWAGLAAAEPASIADVPLAQRIADNAAAGEGPDILVGHHDVSNEFASFIRAGVERAGAEVEGVSATFMGPVGADADAQIDEIETRLDTMDGLAISSVSTEAIIDQAPERQVFKAVNLLATFLKGGEIDDLDTGLGILTQENIAEPQGG